MGKTVRFMAAVAAVVAASAVDGVVNASPPGVEVVPRCADRAFPGASPQYSSLTIDADGSTVAFVSIGNPAGGNADGSEEVFVLQAQTGAITQVTSSPADAEIFYDPPSISDDGDLVAFATNHDVDDTEPETDRAFDLFVYDVSADTIERLTFGGPEVVGSDFNFDSELPAISGDGSTIVFSGYHDGEDRVATVDVATGTVTPLISRPSLGDVGILSAIDHDGSHVAFATNGDLFGTNGDEGTEVFVAVNGSVSQLTDTGGHEPGMDGDGSHVVYLAAGSPAEAYRHDIATDARTKISGTGNTISPLIAAAQSATIDASGSRIAFQSGRNLVGRNADGSYEAYTWDAATHHQITSVANVGIPTGYGTEISADGSTVAYVHRANSTAPDVLHLACSGGTPPPPPRCDGALVTVRLASGQRPTAGNDVILGTNGRDVVNGGRGNDRFCGQGGNDSFSGGAGNDRARGGGGNDVLRGDAGNDLLVGDAGQDTLNGGPQRDTCQGGPQRDTATACEVRSGVP